MTGKWFVRAAAATAIALGFLLIGVLAYKHIYLEREGALGMLWPAVAGLLILWGAGVLDFKGASPALHDLAGQVPLFSPLLRGIVGVVLPGGTRSTDPAPTPATAAIAEVEAALPQSGTTAAAHQFDPGA